MLIDITVVVTTFNEGEYLDSLLSDLGKQEIGGLRVEILLLEAGSYDESRAKKNLGEMCGVLSFLHSPGLSRTEALNHLFEKAKGSLIVRLDARSHVGNDYLRRIYELSRDSTAENVGGVMAPIGCSDEQQLIADIMRHPLSFGGGKSRNLSYRGYADSVYLGAYNKEKCVFGSKWFDHIHPKISEDSDLNYRLRANGGKVFVDSSIIVEHYPRENLKKFFKLCYNYGVGRGLFVLKYRAFSAHRQLAPPLAVGLLILFFIIGFYLKFFFYLAFVFICIYLAILVYAAVGLRKSLRLTFTAIVGFFGCHFFWTTGLLVSPLIFRRDVLNLTRKTKA